MLSLVVAFTPAFCRARAYTSASTSFSGKLAEPTTTEPDAVPPPSGLEPELAEELALVDPAAAGVEELLLEQAATAARPTTASAARPLLGEIVKVMWISLSGVVF